MASLEKQKLVTRFDGPLMKICAYLIEEPLYAQYVMNCFYNQDDIDIEEMKLSEHSVHAQDRINAKMEIKRQKSQIIYEELTFLKNEDFKRRVAELVYWCINQATMRRSESKYSFDLTLYLRGVKRFEGEFKDAGADINRRWKYSSPTKEIPEP